MSQPDQSFDGNDLSNIFKSALSVDNNNNGATAPPPTNTVSANELEAQMMQQHHQQPPQQQHMMPPQQQHMMPPQHQHMPPPHQHMQPPPHHHMHPPPHHQMPPPQHHQMPPPHMHQGQPQQHMPPPPHHVQQQQWQQQRGAPPMGYQQQPQQPPPPPTNPLRPGVFSMQDREYNQNGYQQLRIGDSQRMKGRELAQLVRNQLMAVQSGDRYSDDYYFLKFSERKVKQMVRNPIIQNASEINNSDRPAALLKEMTTLHKMGSTALGLSMQGGKRVPLPRVSERFVDRTFLREKKIKEATLEWEASNKVLGHSTKSNLKRPRELITLVQPSSSPFAPPGNSGTAENADPAVSKPFVRVGWGLRKSIEEAADSVLEIEDMHRLLKAKIATLPPPGSNVALTRENKIAQHQVRDLREKQRKLCNKLGLLLGFSAIDFAVEAPTEIKIESNLQQLLNVIWLPKGRLTVCRVVSCLLPAHHTALMESFFKLLVYFVCKSADGSGDEQAQKEKAMLDNMCMETFGQELHTLDLEHICQCLSVLLESQTPESLRAVIATPGGAGIVRELMMRGQQLVEELPAEDADEADKVQHAEHSKRWSESFEKFIVMAEEGISAKES